MNNAHPTRGARLPTGRRSTLTVKSRTISQVGVLLALSLVGPAACSNDASPTHPVGDDPAVEQAIGGGVPDVIRGRLGRGGALEGVGTLSRSASQLPSPFTGRFDRSDYISQEDVEKAGGSYRLTVEGVGDVLVTEIGSSSGKKCMVHKGSLGDLVRQTIESGRFTEPTFLRMQLYVIPEYDLWICFGLGAGCYIIVTPR